MAQYFNCFEVAFTGNEVGSYEVREKNTGRVYGTCDCHSDAVAFAQELNRAYTYFIDCGGKVVL